MCVCLVGSMFEYACVGLNVCGSACLRVCSCGCGLIYVCVCLVVCLYVCEFVNLWGLYVCLYGMCVCI